MKTKRFLIALVAVLLVLGISFFLFFEKNQHKVEFAKIPVHFFPFGNRATMEVEVEGRKYSLLIDLGSSHPLDFHKKYIEKIQDKEFIGISNFKNMKGDVFTSQKFRIPLVKLLNLTVRDLIACEESVDFINSAKIKPAVGIWNRVKDELQMAVIQGRIGLAFFKESSCLFDFPNSTVFVANNLSSLINEEGCSLEGFVQTPFELNECGIVISVDTDLGIKKFLLDTGATGSALRESLVEKKDAKKSKLGNLFYTNNKFIIEGHDFGDWQFWLLEFSDILKCDGVLGVDFFKKHAICLDFHNKIAYIKRRQTVYERFTDWISKI